jgi:DNA-binding NarL/FixJ family response regulator
LLGAIRAGARGYLLKNAESDELFGAIRRIVSGHAVLTSALTLRLFDHITRTPSVSSGSPLTIREAEILRLIAGGNTNREIAVQLHLSENTIKTHVARVLEKLETSSRAEAVALARARGWISS